MKEMQVGIIGGGRIGRVHAESIVRRVPGVSVKAISDPLMSDELKQFAAQLGISSLVTHEEILLQDKDIDAVLICSPTDTHAQMVRRAVEAGKHIFCEKPVDSDLKRTMETMELVKQSGLFFQIGFNRRFDHNFAALRSAVEAGKVGTPHLLRVTSRDPAPPPASYVAVSGGIFKDMMIHDFDMARFLMGEDIVEVFASGAVLIDPEIGKAGDVDTAVVQLRFQSGALGMIENSREAVYGYDQRAEVFGSGGAVESSNDIASTVKLSGKKGVESEKPLYFFLERYAQAFSSELMAFCDGIRSGGKSRCDTNDAVMALAAAEAAGLSLKENRPVKIAEILQKAGSVSAKIETSVEA